MRSVTDPMSGGRFLFGSSVISAFSLLGVIAGFAINALIAARYGVGPEVDAFFVAYTIPFLLQGLARASCTTVLIPALSRHEVTSSRDETRRFLSVWASASFVAGSVLALIGMIGSPVITCLLAPGLSPEVSSLSTELAQILFGTVAVSWTVSVLRAFLYSHHLFAVPAGLEGIQKTVAVVVFLALGQYVGIAAVAYGYALGTIAQLLVEVAVLVRRWGPRYYYFSLHFTPNDIQTARQISLSLASALLGQGAIAVDRVVASFLPEGSIAVLGYARQLMEIVVQVLLGPMPLALMPSLAASLARNAQDEVRKQLSLLLSFMGGIAIPLGVYLILISTPLVSVLFQRGSFDQRATQLTVATLNMYALGVVLAGYWRAVEFYLYASAKAKQVFMLFCLFGVSTVGFDIALGWLLGTRGIALAYSLALVVPLIIGFVLMRGRLSVSVWRKLFLLNAKIMGACATASFFSSILAITVGARIALSGTFGQFLTGGAMTIAYFSTLLVMFKVLRIEEFNAALAIAAHRMRQAWHRTGKSL